MSGLTISGDIKTVTEKLEALADIHAGQTVGEISEFFDLMTDEQKDKYIELILELHRKNRR